MKLYRKILHCITVLCVFCLFIQPIWTMADDIDEWTFDNSLLIELKSDSIEEGKIYTPSDFPEANIARLILFSSPGEYIAVLNTSGDQAKVEATEKLKINPLVSNVSDNNFIPHQPSVKLNHDKISVTVGEQFSLEALDPNFGSMPGFLDDQITIFLKDYDSEKTYTPQDFPNYDFKEIKKREFNSLTAVLTNPGYYNLCNTIDQLGHDPMIKRVSYVVLPTGQVLQYKWSVSDSSVLKFNTVGNSIEGDSFGLNVVPITALKEGKATVTLEMMAYNKEKTYASCEVTVNSKSPDTGRTNNDSGVLIALIITAFFCEAFVFVQCKGYNRLKGSSK